MRRQRLPPTVDREWIQQLQSWFDDQARGARTRVATTIGCDVAAISRLLSGEAAPAHLVVSVSNVTGIALPAAILPNKQDRELLMAVAAIRNRLGEKRGGAVVGRLIAQAKAAHRAADAYAEELRIIEERRDAAESALLRSLSETEV